MSKWPNKLLNLTQRSTLLFVHGLRPLSHKNPLQPPRKLARRYEPTLMKLKLASILVLLLAGCQDPNKIEEDLRWLLHADPIKDAKIALSEGDTRYVGVVGMFIDVPLFDENCINEKTVRFIKVSDLIESYEQNKLQAIAPVYAESYNFQILQYQKENGQIQCSS